MLLDFSTINGVAGDGSSWLIDESLSFLLYFKVDGLCLHLSGTTGLLGFLLFKLYASTNWCILVCVKVAFGTGCTLHSLMHAVHLSYKHTYTHTHSKLRYKVGF